MSKLIELTTVESFDEVFEKSTNKPVLVFKQSTTCPISAAAFEEFQDYLKSDDKDDEAYYLKVRESREVSNHVADETGLEHKSPQFLLIKDKSVVWDASHNKITAEAIKEAVANA